MQKEWKEVERKRAIMWRPCVCVCVYVYGVFKKINDRENFLRLYYIIHK